MDCFIYKTVDSILGADDDAMRKLRTARFLTNAVIS